TPVRAFPARTTSAGHRGRQSPRCPMTPSSSTPANDRFKESSRRSFWGGLAFAAALHFALFAFTPGIGVADIGRSTVEIDVMAMPPEIPLPPDPMIARPPSPTFVEGDAADPDLTIPPNFGLDNLRELPPPPVSSGDAEGEAIPFTPYDVRPT